MSEKTQKVILDRAFIHQGTFLGPGEVEVSPEVASDLKERMAALRKLEKPAETPEVIAFTGVPAGYQEPGPEPDNGVFDDAVRAKLAIHGFNTSEKITAASDEDLLAIPGIGPKTLEKIRNTGG